MLGINLLVRLGRRLLAGPLEESGLLPQGYYRHQALAALEEEDFPEVLRYLALAAPAAPPETRLVAQIAVLRLRLLEASHERRRQALLNLEDSSALSPEPHKLQELLRHEDLALKLLGQYQAAALNLAGQGGPPASGP
jgi:hypothetical protein